MNETTSTETCPKCKCASTASQQHGICRHADESGDGLVHDGGCASCCVCTTPAIHIAPSIGTPSTCVDTAGALDYDVTVTIGDREIEGEITLSPQQYDGRLASWGGSPDHWVSGGLLQTLRTLDDTTFRSALAAIEQACASGEAVEV